MTWMRRDLQCSGAFQFDKMSSMIQFRLLWRGLGTAPTLCLGFAVQAIDANRWSFSVSTRCKRIPALLVAAVVSAAPHASAQMCKAPELEDRTIGHPECLFYTGTAAFREKKYDEARSSWQQLAERQDLPIDLEHLRTSALNNLGYLNYLGLGSAPDRLLAFRLWNLAVQRGHEEAAYHLCLAQGDQNEPEFDPPVALPYCREARRRYGELKNSENEHDEVVRQLNSYISRLEAK